jgi:hypothetical protein
MARPGTGNILERRNAAGMSDGSHSAGAPDPLASGRSRSAHR